MFYTTRNFHGIRLQILVIFAMPTTDGGTCVDMVTWSGRCLLVFNFACQLFAMPTTDGSACVAMVTWSGSSSLVFNFACQLLCTFLSSSTIYNFVNGDHNSWNISEGEQDLKSRQILAVGYSKKTGKTREILKSM